MTRLTVFMQSRCFCTTSFKFAFRQSNESCDVGGISSPELVVPALFPPSSVPLATVRRYKQVDYIPTDITMTSALELLDNTIAELEARLNLKPGESPVASGSGNDAVTNKKNDNAPNKKKKVKPAPPPSSQKNAGGANHDQPDICKLEFKVGVITKVWVHPTADKLYCEEIDVGESEPRQIASGLRPHFSLEEMLGQRLLVVSNLKAKNLVGFKSFGMVLCAKEPTEDGTSEKVEFVEPPADAPIGEVVTFEGLPAPEPLTAAQVEKKKIFLACVDGLKTTDTGLAVWNGHIFTTSAGPCKAKTILGGAMS
jgi:aminoacyl tRNA synthase complex-interacting multifunctional protein 1